MNVWLLILLTLFIVLGAIVVGHYKFYKYDTSDMKFATKFRVFSAALIFIIVSAYALVKLIVEMLK